MVARFDATLIIENTWKWPNCSCKAREFQMISQCHNRHCVLLMLVIKTAVCIVSMLWIVKCSMVNDCNQYDTVYFSVPIKMQDSTWIHSISLSIRAKWFVIFKFRCIKFVSLNRYGFFLSKSLKYLRWALIDFKWISSSAYFLKLFWLSLPSCAWYHSNNLIQMHAVHQ